MFSSAMHAEKGEAEESEPRYKTARSGDIVMVIDGETFCVPEEDVPKVYYEEDDGQVLPTEQVHEGMQRELQLMKDLEVSERILRTDVPSGKKMYSNGDDPFAKVKGLISDMIARLEEKASAGATHKATTNVCTAQVFLTNMAARYFASFDETQHLEDVHPVIATLREAGVKGTTTPTQLAMDGRATRLRERNKTIGYREMLNFLVTYLSCAGFDACSLQPTNGASGEYAGLLVIMPHISMKIKWIEDSQGMPHEELRRTRQEIEDVMENRTKGLIIVVIELVAVKHHRAGERSDHGASQQVRTQRRTTIPRAK